MAEAIFTGEEIEELAHQEAGRLAAAARTEFAGLAKNLFMRDRPAYARDRYSNDQQLDDLNSQFSCGHALEEAEKPGGVASMAARA